jgi:deoxyadenosine/deoxycytidine kinase
MFHFLNKKLKRQIMANNGTKGNSMFLLKDFWKKLNNNKNNSGNNSKYKICSDWIIFVKNIGKNSVKEKSLSFYSISYQTIGRVSEVLCIKMRLTTITTNVFIPSERAEK